MHVLSLSRYYAPSPSVAVLSGHARLWRAWNCGLEDKMELQGGAGLPGWTGVEAGGRQLPLRPLFGNKTQLVVWPPSSSHLGQ